MVKMSSESRVISTKETSMTSTSETNNAVSYFYSPYVSLAPAVSYTSSLIINLQQLHRDLTDQYQHEKQTLSELNRQFRLFIERVQNLESQNAKYLAQIADFRHQLGMSSNIDEQSSEMYLHHQSDLISANKFRADYEFAYELSQIEVSIYRQLIEAELQGKDQQKSKLEQELKQTSSSLNTLRASYGELEHEVGRLFAEREDINQKYLRMARDWCNVRKLNRESQLTTQTLKSFIRFYQNLRSSSERSVQPVFHSTIDYWRLLLFLDSSDLLQRDRKRIKISGPLNWKMPLRKFVEILKLYMGHCIVKWFNITIHKSMKYGWSWRIVHNMSIPNTRDSLKHNKHLKLNMKKLNKLSRMRKK